MDYGAVVLGWFLFLRAFTGCLALRFVGFGAGVARVGSRFVGLGGVATRVFLRFLGIGGIIIGIRFRFLVFFLIFVCRIVGFVGGVFVLRLVAARLGDFGLVRLDNGIYREDNIPNRVIIHVSALDGGQIRFFLAFGFLDLDHDKPDRIDALREMGFVGLKPYKQLLPYNHEAYYSLYERAQALGMPILFHTGLIAHGTAYDPARPHAFGPENMRPIHLAGIAEAFPELRIIAGHQGYPFMEEMQHNLYYYKNICCDVSGYLRSVDALREILDRRAHDGTDRFFNEKMHFATDEFYGIESSNERALRLAEFWKLYFEFVGGLYYRWGDPVEQEKFFHGNASMLRAEFLRRQGREK